jgi:hypothetical protein
VEPDLSLPGHPEIFVIGDMAHVRDAAGDPLPGMCITNTCMTKRINPLRRCCRGTLEGCTLKNGSRPPALPLTTMAMWKSVFAHAEIAWNIVAIRYRPIGVA